MFEKIGKERFQDMQSILEAARKRFRKGRGIPHEKFWKEVEAEKARKSSKRLRTEKNGPRKR